MLTNFNIGDLLARLNVASKKHLISIKVTYHKFSISILKILWRNGVINGFLVSDGLILVFLKYYQLKPVFRELILISRPGRRVFWTLAFLSNKYVASNFSGFYIISTSRGLVTSNDCLLGLHLTGEVILRVVV